MIRQRTASGSAGPGGSTPATITRRRAIEIIGGASLASASTSVAASSFYRWRGRVLGTVASMAIAGVSADKAAALVRDCICEIRRLEGVFSLYRSQSALSRLNAEKSLLAPAPELLAVLTLADAVHRSSAGAFDPSVQPLWRFYADRYARNPNRKDAPTDEALARVRRAVGWRHVDFTGERIVFRRRGMALTLNGIAQGYIGDQVAALFRRAGLRQALVNMGEVTAIGHHPSGRHWRAGIGQPGTADHVASVLTLDDAAVATSGHHGTHFDAAGQLSHIIDPRTGRPAMGAKSTTVVAPSSAVADGLSTAATLLSTKQIRRLAGEFPGATVYRTSPSGPTVQIAPAPA